MTGAELLVKSLRERGVEWIATLCGHGLDPFFNAAHHGGLRLIDVRNEQTCAYVAQQEKERVELSRAPGARANRWRKRDRGAGHGDGRRLLLEAPSASPTTRSQSLAKGRNLATFSAGATQFVLSQVTS